MKNASKVGGSRVLLTERSTAESDKMEIFQSNAMREFYSDGIAGLIVNSSIVKVDFFTNDVIYDDQETGFTNKEQRVITHRLVMPVAQFTEFVCHYLAQIDFEGVDAQHKDLSSLADKLTTALINKKNG